jgi:hypothetical protein
MLELSLFYDFTGFDALHADAYPHGNAFYHGSHRLQIRKEPAPIYARDLLADAAFFLCQAAAGYGSACDRFFAADLANF